jgi:antiviral helicase SKI2
MVAVHLQVFPLMDTHEQAVIIDRILQTSPDNAEKLLEELGHASLPSREQVHRAIETKLLLPPKRIPDHWLPTYQMYESPQFSAIFYAKQLIHRHWEHRLSIPSLLTFGPSPPPTSLSFVRVGLDGRVTGYTEVNLEMGLYLNKI